MISHHYSEANINNTIHNYTILLHCNSKLNTYAGNDERETKIKIEDTSKREKEINKISLHLTQITFYDIDIVILRLRKMLPTEVKLKTYFLHISRRAATLIAAMLVSYSLNSTRNNFSFPPFWLLM